MLLMHTDNCDYNFLQHHDAQLIIHFAEENDSYRQHTAGDRFVNPLKPELNSICYLLALLGAHHFLHVSRIRVKLLTLR
jgi:transposase